MRRRFYISIVLLFTLSACEEEIDLDIPVQPQEFVVEAYVSTFHTQLNYLLLSTTQDYFNPSLRTTGVAGATGSIAEGIVNAPGDTQWLKELAIVEFTPVPGIYYFPLSGESGKVYKLKVQVQGRLISGVTSIPAVVEIDSLRYMIEDNPQSDEPNVTFISSFLDPPQRGNNYMLLLETGSYLPSLWGSSNEIDITDDDVLNGMERKAQYLSDVKVGDTVQYFVNSIDRSSYNFWDSYLSARYNGGPFATPVKLKSTVTGAIGSFTGLAVSHKSIVIK